MGRQFSTGSLIQWCKHYNLLSVTCKLLSWTFCDSNCPRYILEYSTSVSIQKALTVRAFNLNLSHLDKADTENIILRDFTMIKYHAYLCNRGQMISPFLRKHITWITIYWGIFVIIELRFTPATRINSTLGGWIWWTRILNT